MMNDSHRMVSRLNESDDMRVRKFEVPKQHQDPNDWQGLMNVFAYRLSDLPDIHDINGLHGG